MDARRDASRMMYENPDFAAGQMMRELYTRIAHYSSPGANRAARGRLDFELLPLAIDRIATQVRSSVRARYDRFWWCASRGRARSEFLLPGLFVGQPERLGERKRRGGP